MIADQIAVSPAPRKEGDASPRFAQRVEQAVRQVGRAEAVDHGPHAHAAPRGGRHGVEDARSRLVMLEDIHDHVDAAHRARQVGEQPLQPPVAVDDDVEAMTGDLCLQHVGLAGGKVGGHALLIGRRAKGPQGEGGLDRSVFESGFAKNGHDDRIVL